MHQVIENVLTVGQIRDIAYEYQNNSEHIPTSRFTANIARYIDDTLAYELSRVNVNIIHVDGQPYATTDEMRAHIAMGTLLISVDYASDPYLTIEQLLKFRALHDLHHCRTADCNFNLWGECCAYNLAQKQATSSFVKDWLFSEIVAQTCMLRVTGEFPVQRRVLISPVFRLQIERMYSEN